MLEVIHLDKAYGNHIAVKDLNFTVEENQIFGFLGLNGAGKSTTMNIITGYLAPTSGTVKIDGIDVLDDPLEARKRIGYLPEIPPLYPDFTPYEYLKFVAKARGVKKEDLDNEIDRVIKLVSIEEYRNRLIRTLSKGYKQRLGMAEAMIGNPRIIIMDEPTAGLDPLQIIEFRGLLKKLAEDHTVIVSSHVLAEISEVCDQVMIIAEGKMIDIDSFHNLSEKYGSGERELTLEEIFLKAIEKEESEEYKEEEEKDA